MRLDFSVLWSLRFFGHASLPPLCGSKRSRSTEGAKSRCEGFFRIFASATSAKLKDAPMRRSASSFARFVKARPMQRLHSLQLRLRKASKRRNSLAPPKSLPLYLLFFGRASSLSFLGSSLSRSEGSFRFFGFAEVAEAKKRTERSKRSRSTKEKS